MHTTAYVMLQGNDVIGTCELDIAPEALGFSFDNFGRPPALVRPRMWGSFTASNGFENPPIEADDDFYLVPVDFYLSSCGLFDLDCEGVTQ